MHLFDKPRRYKYKTLMRYWGVLLAAFLLGCAHHGTVVEVSEGADFGRFHRIGVLPFSDRRGQGLRIAEGVEAGLRGLSFEVADRKILGKILAKDRPDPFYGLNIEALSQIRMQTSADAIVFGAVAPNWRQASMSLFDVEQGDTVLRATLKPGRGKKVFSSPEEVAAEAVRVLGAAPVPAAGE